MSKVKKHHIILFFIIIIGGILRFHNLDWGDGNFFHPDEGNIGSAVTQLDIENGDYNPNFFAYGTLPIYIMHFYAEQDFSKAMLFGRFLSAFFSTLTIPLVYLITRDLGKSLIRRLKTHGHNVSVGMYALGAATLTAFSPGLIQFAHFATFETYLGFEHLITVWFAIKVMQRANWGSYIWLGIVLGLSIATKIPSVAFVPIIFLAHGYAILKLRHEHTNRLRFISQFLKHFFLSAKLFVSLALVAIVSVLNTLYFFTDQQTFNDYRNSLSYEGPVATGEIIRFYTEQYIETTPVIYQVTKVFPVIIGWPLTIVGIISAVYVLVYSIKFALKFVFKNKFSHKAEISLFTAIMVVYAAFNFYLFVKWTRYMIPLTPFLIITTALLLLKVTSLTREKLHFIPNSLFLFLIIFEVLIGLNFFTIYLKPDPRLEARAWVNANVPRESFVLTETADRGVPAIRGDIIYENIKEYNFYELDDGHNPEGKLQSLIAEIEKTEYIFVPSKRIFPTRSRLPDKFPLGNRYYESLFGGELGFELVAQFDRSTFIEAWWQQNVIDKQQSVESTKEPRPLNYDETFKVFDQPTVYIFKKTNPEVDYSSLFNDLTNVQET